MTATATSLTLDTPSQTTPDAPIILTGTYQGDPQALDYDFGAGWVEASSATFDDGTYSITVPGGVAFGSYMPEVRDNTATSVTASAGTFVVSDWTPETLQASPGATAVFEFNANDPAVAPGANGAAIGSVVNSLDSAESLTAMRASGGNPVVIAYNSGAGGDSRVLQFYPTTISPNLYDPSTNWLDAGGVDGPAGSALVDLANSSDLATNGSFTTVIAVDVSKSYTYEAGPIWGALASPGPLQYVQLRINNGSDEQGADLTDSSEDTVNAQGTVTAGWHVMTMIKDGNLLIYRLDGVVVQTSVVTSTKPFTASDFLIGGGFPQGPTADLSQENGVPTPDIGEFQAYSGVLQGTDLTNAEALAGNSIGVPLPSGNIASQVIWLPDTPTSYAAAAGDTVNGGAGAATVTAAAGSVVVNGGSGPLWFIGGSASSTVAGGAGVDTVIGGAGGGVFGSGSAGGSVLVASGGNTSLTGGGAGDETVRCGRRQRRHGGGIQRRQPDRRRRQHHHDRRRHIRRRHLHRWRYHRERRGGGSRHRGGRFGFAERQRAAGRCDLRRLGCARRSGKRDRERFDRRRQRCAFRGWETGPTCSWLRPAARRTSTPAMAPA